MFARILKLVLLSECVKDLSECAKYVREDRDDPDHGGTQLARGDPEKARRALNSKTLLFFVRKDATTEPLSQLTEWLSGGILSDEHVWLRCIRENTRTCVQHGRTFADMEDNTFNTYFPLQQHVCVTSHQLLFILEEHDPRRREEGYEDGTGARGGKVTVYTCSQTKRPV